MRVMVVEDDDDLRELLIRAVGRQHDVRGYALGTEALHVFDSEAWVPEAVVSDLALPDVPGEQLARVAIRYRARVVLISGDRTRLSEARDIADRTLAKPFTIRDLLAAVDLEGH